MKGGPYWDMGKLAYRWFGFLLSPLIFVPALAQALESPFPIGFFCHPDTTSIVEGQYYLPQSAPCMYESASLGTGSRYGIIYRGTIGSSTAISSHSMTGTLTPEYSDIASFAQHGIQQGEDMFVVIYKVRQPFSVYQDPVLFDEFFKGVRSTPPHMNFGFIRFKYGEEPEPARCTENCYSNILFIPGFQASELFEGSSRRWIPGLLNSDGERLEMTSEGESVHDIKVGEAIDTVRFGGVPVLEIYGGFFDLLESFVDDGFITEWKAVPYDWRYASDEVASMQIRAFDGSSHSMEANLRELASTSKTEKVTIVAHSNGGLVGKALISELGEGADLIDKFILIGSPQLGAPSAIAGILHGIGQGLPLDSAPFSMSPATAREVALNMPGAYGLLPIGRYAELAERPLVEFEDSPILQHLTHAYGTLIDSQDELHAFLRAELDGRPDPHRDETLKPAVVNPKLIESALGLRRLLENWSPPEHIEVTQIVGWGLDTVSGLRYRERECPIGAACAIYLDVEPVFSLNGDQTVLLESAAAMDTTTYYLNLPAHNLTNGSSWRHVNLLSAPGVQTTVRDIITGKRPVAADVSETISNTIDALERLRISVHSPVSLEVRDDLGRSVGVNSDIGYATNISVIRQDIPNSYYLEFGEGKYVGVIGPGMYEVVLVGTGHGTFDLRIEQFHGEEITGTVDFSRVPVSLSAQAYARVSVDSENPTLMIDHDGNGAIDEIRYPDKYFETLLARLKDYIVASSANSGIKKSLIRRIDLLESWNKEANSIPSHIVATLEVALTNLERAATISDPDSLEIAELLNKIQNYLVNASAI